MRKLVVVVLALAAAAQAANFDPPDIRTLWMYGVDREPGSVSIVLDSATCGVRCVPEIDITDWTNPYTGRSIVIRHRARTDRRGVTRYFGRHVDQYHRVTVRARWRYDQLVAFDLRHARGPRWRQTITVIPYGHFTMEKVVRADIRPVE